MNVEFKSSFEKDLRRIKEKKVRIQIREIILQVELAKNIQQLENLRKLRGSENYYRIKMGEYRLGLSIENDLVVFVRVLNRKDIYRYFP